MSRFAVIPAVYLYLLRDSGDSPGSARGTEVLLQLRRGTGYMDGHWAAGAAGHVERSEAAMTALRREAREELGVDVADPTFELTMQRTQGGDDVDERVDFFYSARSWRGSPTLQEPDKAAELRWWPVAALPAAMVPHERIAIEHLGLGAGLISLGFAGALPPGGAGRSAPGQEGARALP